MFRCPVDRGRLYDQPESVNMVMDFANLCLEGGVNGSVKIT